MCMKSEPALKKQKLDADELCTCTSLIDAAEHQHIKCVAKYITDINNAGIKPLCCFQSSMSPKRVSIRDVQSV